MKAAQLVSRLLTVPREERSRVLAQEGPISWDSVTFFAVRDGLRDARFHGQMSAADYIDTLEEVERRYEEGASARSTSRAPILDGEDDETADLIPPEGDGAFDDGSTLAVSPLPVEEPSKRERVAVEHSTRIDRRPPAPAPAATAALPAVERPESTPASTPALTMAPARATTPAASTPSPAPASAPAPAETQAQAPISPPRVEFVAGATIRNRYVLQQQIGRGGNGIVFRARDLRRDALVALKVLREQLRNDPDKIERLKREFQQAQALAHPNIIRVFDVDCEGDAWFLTMELIDGESLRSHLASMRPRRGSQRNAFAIIHACADALIFAHEHGVVHGDFKPGNVLLSRDRQVRVLDFGVAANSPEWSERSVPSIETHVAAATPAYASPEVLVGQQPQIRDDVYSFACVAYEVLTRQHPFERHSAIVARQRGIKVRRLPGLSRSQFAILKRGLAWSRSNRPATVRELVDELRSPSPKRQPFGFWFATAVVALGTFVAVTFFLDNDRPVTTSGPKTVAPAEAPVTAANAPEPEIQQPPATPAPAPVEADRSQAAAPKTSPLTTSPLTDTPSRAPVVSQKPPAAPPEPQPSTEVAAAPKVSTPSPADEAATTAVIRQQALSRAGTVSLQQANIVVSERATHAVIRIQRRDDYRGGITVQWRTIPGSAQPGIDYSPIGAGSLVIPEDQDSRVIYIPLMKNDASQSNEWFDLELTSVTGGARLGPITRTRITILDDH